MAQLLGNTGKPHERAPGTADRLMAFGHCRFNAHTGQLWRNGRESRLTPRAAAVLTVLIEHAEHIVTKQMLTERVWSSLAVGDDALTSCIQELRQALGDNARKPSYIETRHRRGYRLITPVAVAPPTVRPPPRQRLVGREEPLSELDRRLELALGGQRQLVLVSGEPGIGKSALVNSFLGGLGADSGVRIGHGQCLDHHGAGEPYLPTSGSAASEKQKLGPLFVGGFGSYHAGGVNIGLADGCTRFLTLQVDPTTLRQLGNRADGEIMKLY